MKKIIIVIFLFTNLAAKNQVYLGVNAGVNSYLTCGLTVGWQNRNFTIESNMKITLDRKVAHPSYFGGSVGYVIAPYRKIQLIPIVGYYFRLHSTDKKELNEWDYSLSLRGVWNHITVEPGVIGGRLNLSVGIISFL